MFDVEVLRREHGGDRGEQARPVEGGNVEPLRGVDGAGTYHDAVGAPERAQQLGVASEVLAVDGKDIGARCFLDPAHDRRIVAGNAGRLCPPAADQVPRVETGEIREGERFLHELVELTKLLVLPPLEAVGAHATEDEQGARPFRRVEMRGDRENRRLAQPVGLSDGGKEQVPVLDQQRNLLLCGRAELEPADQSSCNGDTVRSVANGVRNQRGEKQPVGMRQLLELGGEGVGLVDGPKPLDRRPSVGRSRIELERIGGPVAQGLRQLRNGRLQDTERVEESPRAGVASLDQREEGRRHGAAERQLPRIDRAQPVEQRRRRAGVGHERGRLERDLEAEVSRRPGP